MTEFQSFMLSVCFGAVVGTLIGSWSFIIKEWLRARKEKKNRKQKESDQVSEE